MKKTLIIAVLALSSLTNSILADQIKGVLVQVSPAREGRCDEVCKSVGLQVQPGQIFPLRQALFNHLKGDQSGGAIYKFSKENTDVAFCFCNGQVGGGAVTCPGVNVQGP